MIRYAIIAIAVIASLTGNASAGKVVLKKSWIKKHMNQATTTIQFTIAHSSVIHDVAESGDDGDIHAAGSADQDGLPMVAEVLNAKDEDTAVSIFKGNEGTAVRMDGAWRIWFEHPSPSKQVQGGTNKLTGKPSNPDHVFEIHPVTRLRNENLNGSIRWIKGYTAKDNVKTFGHYESRILDGWDIASNTIEIETGKAYYNYAIFAIRPTSAPVATKSGDGRMLFAEVRDTNGKPLRSQGEPVVSGARRMVFLMGTDPDQKLTGNVVGKCMKVMGIPRVNLERLAYVMNHSDEFADQEVPLPYEMLIIGAEAPKACPGSD
jgi:hypothetical protein